jgi:hypothetical protein
VQVIFTLLPPPLVKMEKMGVSNGRRLGLLKLVQQPRKGVVNCEEEEEEEAKGKNGPHQFSFPFHSRFLFCFMPVASC